MKAAAWFERPEKVLAAFIGFSLLAWTIQCSLLQNVLGIDIYETIVWGEQFQWGNSKHPPLSGWIGYFFSAATGHSDWGMYLAAQLCISLGVFFTFKLARMFFDAFRAATAALLLYFLIYYTPSEMKFSTYFVEMAVAPAASYLMLRALRENRLYLWLILGGVCGLGMLNKYSFALVLAAFFIIMATGREYRRRFASPGPYCAVLMLLLVISPHVKWLAEHDFICFKHVGGRLKEEHDLLMPLYVLLAALYPVAMETLVLLVSGIRRAGEGGWKRRFAEAAKLLPGGARTDIDRAALHFSAPLSLLPGAAYLLLSLTGTDIILMWLCSTASASGILVLSLFPVKIDASRFKRIALLLAVYVGIVFAATTLDLMFRTVKSLHLDPHAVVAEAETFWRGRSAEPIRVVVGGLRYAALFDHYSPGHPPVCDPEDELAIGLYRERIQKYGALLIDRDAAEIDKILIRVEAPEKPKPETLRVSYRSLFGRRRVCTFAVAYLPPGTRIK